MARDTTRQVGEQVIGLTRTILASAIEVPGSVARTAVRATADVTIEVIQSVRSTASALLVAPADYEPEVADSRRTNGGSTDLAA
ncbi:MAG: hypothetical protein ABW298_03295 [Candidatus Binatia bacterium]